MLSPAVSTALATGLVPVSDVTVGFTTTLSTGIVSLFTAVALSVTKAVSPFIDVAPLFADSIPLVTEDWWFVFRNADYLLAGAALTVFLTVASLSLGFAVGFPAGAIEVYGGKWSTSAVESVGVVLRGTPLVVILVVMYFIVGVPDLYFGVATMSGAVASAILGLGLRSAAYQSQIARAALQSIDEGQLEAARALGMSQYEAVRHVVAPQALRRSVPGFQNEMTIVLKDTSIVFAIGLAELLTRSHDLFVEQTTAVLEVIVFISAIYFALTFATNRLLDYASDYYAIPGGEHV